MTDTRVVLVTAPEQEVAVRLCHTLLTEGLIACGNIVPGVTSVYRWEGSVKEDSEVLAILKTGSGCVGELIRRVAELHPYEVPEALVLNVDAGLEPYLNWVTRETGPRESS